MTLRASLWVVPLGLTIIGGALHPSCTPTKLGSTKAVTVDQIANERPISPPPGPTKRLQDRWMGFGEWKFIRHMPASLYGNDQIGKVIRQSCSRDECYEVIIQREAYDQKGNRMPDYVSYWGRLRKR